MRSPWLIQRCRLDGVKLVYDYMGSNEFERGEQAESLKRIFAAGMMTNMVTVKIDDQEVAIRMVAGVGFDFVAYQPYLQKIVDRKQHLQEQTGFDEAVRKKLGIPAHCYRDVNAWFDFINDVLWTTDEADYGTLLETLVGIQDKWTTAEAAQVSVAGQEDVV